MAGIAEALGQKTFKIQDNVGKEHEIPTLTFGDARDLEKAIGCSLGEASNLLSSFDGQIKILWGVLRREGLTRQQIREARATGKWTITEEDVADMFDLTQANIVFGIITQAMHVGGWEGKGDPTTSGVPDAGKQDSPKTTLQ